MADIIQHRRDTLENWSAANPILADGEMGIVTDDPNKYKIGDGVHSWNELKFRGFNGTVTSEVTDEENTVPSNEAVTTCIFDNNTVNLKSFNLLEGATEGFYLDSSGNLVTRPDYYVSDFIELKDLQSIYLMNIILGSGSIIFYDKNKNQVLDYEGLSSNVSLALGKNNYLIRRRGGLKSRYIRISFKTDAQKNPPIYYLTDIFILQKYFSFIDDLCLQEPGDSTTNPMSQKAVTDFVNSKAISEITKEEKSLIDNYGTSLLSGNYISGKYLDVDNEEIDDSQYYISDYIPFLGNNDKIILTNISLDKGYIHIYDFFGNRVLQYPANSSEIVIELAKNTYLLRRRGGIGSEKVRISFSTIENLTPYYFRDNTRYNEIIFNEIDNEFFNIKENLLQIQNVIEIGNSKPIPLDPDLKDKFFIEGGYTGNNSSYWGTEYIPINSEFIYVNQNIIGGSSICFYDINKKFLFSCPSTDENIVVALDNNIFRIKKQGNPDITAFVRFSIKDVTDYAYYTDSLPFTTAKLTNNATNNLIKKSKKLYPLFGEVSNKYYTSEGLVKEFQHFGSYIYDVEKIDILNLIYCPSIGNEPSDLCPIIFLDSDGNVVKTINEFNYHYDIDVKGINKVIISCRGMLLPFIGTTYNIIKEPIIFKGELTNLSVQEKIEWSDNYIKKNTNIVVIGRIKNTFSKLIIKKGQDQYFHDSIEFTNNAVKKSTETKTYGFTLEDNQIVRFEVISDNTNNCIIKVTADNNYIEIPIGTFYADYSCTISSDGLEVLSAQYLILDSQRKVRFYGDSYSGTSSNIRWPKQAANLGCKFLVNGLTGGGSIGLRALPINDISHLGVPDVILWGLGMNDGSGLDENWKIVINNLKTFCETFNILFIPCTIPSVPSRSHEAKNEYIRNNFKRYVDFAKAVENNTDDNWIEGALSTDNVHPTELGAQLLALRAISDCPELFDY